MRRRKIAPMSADDRVDFTHQFLVAMPGLASDEFAGTVVYLCEHNAQGAMGLVINKTIDISLRHLFDKVDLKLNRPDLAAAPVFYGGPVQTERGFVLHERLNADGGHYNSSMKLGDGLEMTTSKDVLEAVSSGAGPRRLLVTLGYSGWAAGQLEDEMRRNSWINVPAAADIIFDTPIEQRYDRALSLLGIDARMLSQDAGHA
jgi:putative transcriptional regulator